MNSDVSKLVVALAQGKMSVAETTFNTLMSSKVNDALDTRKIAVASAIYNTPKTN